MTLAYRTYFNDRARGNLRGTTPQDGYLRPDDYPDAAVFVDRFGTQSPASRNPLWRFYNHPTGHMVALFMDGSVRVRHDEQRRLQDVDFTWQQRGDYLIETENQNKLKNVSKFWKWLDGKGPLP
jgi:hypothetical protein